MRGIPSLVMQSRMHATPPHMLAHVMLLLIMMYLVYKQAAACICMHVHLCARHFGPVLCVQILALPKHCQSAHAPLMTQHAPRAAIILGCIGYSAYAPRVLGNCQGYEETTLD